MTTLKQLEGIIEDVVFYNEENGYTIAVLDTQDLFIHIKGIMPFLAEGDRVRVAGQMVIHKLYGEQLDVKYIEHLKPSDVDDILRYLSSGIIKGIGEVTAGLIVDHFGAESLEIIQYQPEKLLTIPGIGEKKLEQIIESYREQFELRDMVMYFQSLNISIHMAMKIYKAIGIDAVQKVQKNPYILAEEVSGIGFKFADQLAMRMGVEAHSPFRIKSGMIYILNIEATSGNVYMFKAELIRRVSLELKVTQEEVELEMSNCLVKGDLQLEMVEEEMRIYLPSLYYAEMQVAQKLVALMTHARPINFYAFDDFINEYEEARGILLDDRQKEAVKLAMTEGVYIITGGPGTGKTTIINAIIAAYEVYEKKLLLAAPTGRAAKRMTEATQREAKTIHRLLEFQGEFEFTKNEDEPLDADVIIIDEISMVDTLLMYRLLDAVKLGTHILFVGDADQLPSVGPGSVLRDLLASQMIKFTQLKEIYRQSDASLIAVNAHLINRGEMPLLNKQDKDFFFISRQGSGKIADEIKALVTERIPQYYGVDPMEDIQVLSPMKNAPTGVNALNEMLQAIINPPSPNKQEHKFTGKILRVGDKVMQIKNNYNLEWTTELGEEGTGVFNGDIGFVQSIDSEERLFVVKYDGEREVTYDYVSADELTLAYAITVHKSQGSEFKVVIMPMTYAPPMLMSRNILYTAITRAKQLVILVGDKKAMMEMTKRNHENKRYSGLKDKLIKLGLMFEVSDT